MNQIDINVAELQEKIADLERRLAEAETDRRLLDFLMDHLPGGVTILDPNGKIKYVSRFGASIGGKQRQDLEGRSMADAFGSWDAYFPDGVTPMKLEDYPFAESLQSGNAITNIEAIVRKEGDTHLIINFNPIVADNSNVTGAIVTWWDITAQKAGQDALKNLAKFPEENPNPVLRVSADGVILYANLASQALLNDWEKNDLGKVPHFVQNVIGCCLLKKTSQCLEISDGSKIYDFHFSPIHESGYVNIYGFDITERRRIENELEASERRFRSLFETSPDAVLITAHEGSILAANPAACDMFGRTEQEILGLNRSDLLDTNDPRFAVALEDRTKFGYIKARELTAIRRNGERFPVEVDSVILGNKQPQSFVNLRDISERKQVENALRASEERLSDFLESTKDSIFSLDREWRIVYINQRFADKIGLPFDELIGRNFWELFPKYLGTEIERNYQQVMTDRKPIHFPASGRYTNNYFEISVYPSLDGIAVFASDRTAQHEAEQALHENEVALREYSVKLERSNQDLQEFAFIASHDLQEPLRKISAFGNSLLDQSENLNEHQQDYLKRMRSGADRLQQMITDLLSLSRVATQGRPFEAVDLSQVCAEILSDLEFQIRRTDGTVEMGDLPIIHGDRLQMRQLLQNLISNALKYHKADSPPVVRVYSLPVSATQVQIIIQDNGIGFDDKFVDQIFQPFRRLVSKTEYEGTGIGLAICKKIVERHGGEITAHSTSGEGSTFVITLPS